MNGREQIVKDSEADYKHWRKLWKAGKITGKEFTNTVLRLERQLDEALCDYAGRGW